MERGPSNILHRSAQTGSLALEESKRGRGGGGSAPALVPVHAKALQRLSKWRFISSTQAGRESLKVKMK